MERRRKFLRIGIALAAMHALILFAGFFAPYDPSQQDRALPFAPPARVHFLDARGRPHFRPLVYARVPAPEGPGYVEDRRRALPVRFFVRGAPYRIAGVIPSRLHLFGLGAPDRVLLFGTDALGRDLFSRTLYGGQVSLLAGLLATGFALGTGLLLGGVAGYYGRWVDEVLMRLAELFVALPWLYLVLAIRAFLPLDMSPRGAFLLVVSVIGAVGWARPARLIRGVVLAGRERDYVKAARGFGAANLYLLRRHVLPQTYGLVLTQAALLLPQYVLAEVTLSFLGLGVGEPEPSWENLLASLSQYHVLVSYWWMFLPGLALVPFFLAYASLAQALEDRASKPTL